MPNLYTVTQEVKKEIEDFFTLSDQCDEDGDPIDEQTMADTLEGIAAPFNQKACNVAKYIRNLEVEAQACKDAARNMSERARVKLAYASRLKAYLIGAMTELEVKAVEDPEIKVSTRKLPGKLCIDSTMVPNRYWVERTERDLDKAAIKQDIKSGAEIPGAWIEKGTGLTIK